MCRPVSFGSLGVLLSGQITFHSARDSSQYVIVWSIVGHSASYLFIYKWNCKWNLRHSLWENFITSQQHTWNNRSMHLVAKGLTLFKLMKIFCWLSFRYSELTSNNSFPISNYNWLLISLTYYIHLFDWYRSLVAAIFISTRWIRFAMEIYKLYKYEYIGFCSVLEVFFL